MWLFRVSFSSRCCSSSSSCLYFCWKAFLNPPNKFVVCDGCSVIWNTTGCTALCFSALGVSSSILFGRNKYCEGPVGSRLNSCSISSSGSFCVLFGRKFAPNCLLDSSCVFSRDEEEFSCALWLCEFGLNRSKIFPAFEWLFAKQSLRDLEEFTFPSLSEGRALLESFESCS